MFKHPLADLDRQKRERQFAKSINRLGPNRQNYTARYLLFGGTPDVSEHPTFQTPRRFDPAFQSQSWFRRYLKALSTGVAAASIGTVGLLSQPAYGANDTWVGNTSNLWNVPANWSALPVTGDSLQFGAAASSGLTLSDNLMTPGTFNVAGVTFTSAAGAYVINPATAGTNGFTLTGDITNNSTNTVTINDDIVTTAGRTVTTVPGGGVTLGGNISGTGGGLSLTGGGNLTLAGAVNYTGTRPSTPAL